MQGLIRVLLILLLIPTVLFAGLGGLFCVVNGLHTASLSGPEEAHMMGMVLAGLGVIGIAIAIPSALLLRRLMLASMRGQP